MTHPVTAPFGLSGPIFLQSPNLTRLSLGRAPGCHTGRRPILRSGGGFAEYA